jgi:urocanate hydratase
MSDELVLRFGQKQPDGSYPVFIGDEPVGVFQPPFSGDLTTEVAETKAAVRLEQVLTADPWTAIIRHVDAGYERAIEVAKEHVIKIPMMK